ncbi:response regulator transcription factor [Alteromonas gilva]|uniref:Response regulator transcription factor n=1 Tax=Alteromonas gilva TaxID=2987522 RepID=A0ABT5KZ67_9ALTE|nr:response regulator transcription factor [Alteromonas gilva]MDC8830055.1 response regulator transcription factor [Alteromonas gilva]
MILVISNDRTKSRSLVACIERVSAECDVTGATEQAVKRCVQQQYPVVILDSFSRLANHYETIQQLQRDAPDCAIIVVARQGCDAERIMSLELGAQDYIEYPFNPAELQARVRVQLRRAELTKNKSRTMQQPVKIGGFAIDNSYHRAEVDGKVLPLTAKEFALLHFLASHPNQVFSREQLLSSVWGYHYGGFEHTVASHINRLRSKLNKTRAGAHLVETVWGVGYKFNSASLEMVQTA